MTVDRVPPTGILAVTFTNKAAKEMRYRIEQMMDIPARGLWFGTFHGIAHRLLRAHWKDAGLSENFQVLDSDDQLRLIKRVMRKTRLMRASGRRSRPSGLSVARRTIGAAGGSYPGESGRPFPVDHAEDLSPVRKTLPAGWSGGFWRVVAAIP